MSGSLGAVSNREDWIIEGTVVDQNGDDIVITAATIKFAVSRKGCCSPVLSATNGDHLTIATPVFTVAFTRDQMTALCAGQYDVGCTAAIVGVTTQVFTGTVTIYDGVVSR